MKTLIIIGSTGFLGESILKFLEKKNNSNIKKLILYSFSRKNIISKEIKKNYIVEQIQVDFSLIKEIKYADFIIYAAMSDNIKKEYSIIQNLCKILDNRFQKSKLIFISSGAVYGELKKTPANEKLQLNYKSYKGTFKKKYAKLKIDNELKLKKIKNKLLNLIILRSFTFVGPTIPLKSRFAAGNIIDSVLNKKKIILKSKIKVFRSYLHTDDFSRILIRLFFKKFKKKINIYNLGSDDYVDLHTLAKKIAFKYKQNLEVQKKINKKIDFYIPCISKLRKDLRIKKKFNSLNAINKTIKELSY